MLSLADPLASVLLPAVLAAFFAFVVVISWRYPQYIFFLIFFFRPLLDMTRLLKGKEEIVQSMIKATGVIIPAILLITLILHKKALTDDNFLVLFFMVIILVMALFHEGKDARAGEIIVRTVTPLVLIIFPAVVIESERDLKTFLRLIGISIVFVLVAVFLDRTRTNIHPVHGWVQDVIVLPGGQTRNRLAAVFGVPTVTGYWLFLFFVLAYFLFETDRGLRRWIWLGACFALSVPLFYVFSRSAWIGCAIAIFLYNLFKGRLGRTMALLTGGAILVAIVLPQILYRLQDLRTMQHRLLLWKGYFQTMLDKGAAAWLTGLGWSDLPEKNIYTGHLIIPGSTGLTENSFIFILVGSGILALIVFILIVLRLVRRSIWLAKNGGTPFIRAFGIWSIALLVAWLAMSTTGEVVTYVVINWYFYAFFGCALGLWANREKLQPEAARRELNNRIPEPEPSG